jgi:hypothetical protein
LDTKRIDAFTHQSTKIPLKVPTVPIKYTFLEGKDKNTHIYVYFYWTIMFDNCSIFSSISSTAHGVKLCPSIPISNDRPSGGRAP